MSNHRPLPIQKAVSFSRQYSRLYNQKFNNIQDSDLVAINSLPSLAIVIPNYNNSRVIDAVLASIFRQTNINFTLYLMDNCSSDDSWKKISSYKSRCSNFKAVRHRVNLGSSINCNMLVRSIYEDFLLFASGNDILVGDLVVAKMLNFIHFNPGIDLVYGRNVRNSAFCESPDYCFSIPSLEDRASCSLSSYDCMDIATWLYTSSEPLWGLYRSSALKIVPQCEGYGSDHVLLSTIAANGGIVGLNLAFREVEPERRSNKDLVKFQDPSSYSTNNSTSLHPITQCNMCMLSKSYFEGLSNMNFIDSTLSNELAIHRSLIILVSRFPSIYFNELGYIASRTNCTPSSSDSLSVEPSLAISNFYWQQNDHFFRQVLIFYLKLVVINEYSWNFS